MLNWLSPIVTAFGLLAGSIATIVGFGPALTALFTVGGGALLLNRLFPDKALPGQPGNPVAPGNPARPNYYPHGPSVHQREQNAAGGGGRDQATEPDAHRPPYSGGTGSHKGQRSLLLGGAHGGGNPGTSAYNVQKAYDLIKKAGGSDEEARTLAAISRPFCCPHRGMTLTEGREINPYLPGALKLTFFWSA